MLYEHRVETPELLRVFYCDPCDTPVNLREELGGIGGLAFFFNIYFLLPNAATAGFEWGAGLVSYTGTSDLHSVSYVL